MQWPFHLKNCSIFHTALIVKNISDPSMPIFLYFPWGHSSGTSSVLLLPQPVVTQLSFLGFFHLVFPNTRSLSLFLRFHGAHLLVLGWPKSSFGFFRDVTERPEWTFGSIQDWGQEKGETENEMVGWYHWLNRHEFEQASGDSER